MSFTDPDKTLWPFGPADHLQPASVPSGNLAVAIDNNHTLLEPSELVGGNQVLDITPDPELRIGARVVLKQKTTGIEQTSFGTSITAPAIVGVAGKTMLQAFEWDGAGFVAVGPFVQID